MSEEVEHRCFIGGLAWATKDSGLEDAFEKFGRIIEAKVSVDRYSGRSRGFGFVSFEEKAAMEEAIKSMNGIDLDGRTITVEKAQPHQGGGGGRDRDGGGRDRDGGGRDRDGGGRDRDRGRDRDYGGGGGGRGGGGDCFKCGKPGHFARECPGEDRGGGGRYGGRDDRYGGGGGGGSRYGGGGPDRNGDRYGGRSRDSDGRGGGDRYGRDRSRPYERRSSGGYR